VYITQAEMEEEPLAVGKVLVTVTGVRQLVQAWTRNRHRSLYDSAAGYVALVCEVGRLNTVVGWGSDNWWQWWLSAAWRFVVDLGHLLTMHILVRQ
jgi:hypothetical protein